MQRGATLVIGMIMLVLVTLFVLAAINMSTINLLIMGNEQARNESIAAAQQAIEQVVSTDFTTNPRRRDRRRSSTSTATERPIYSVAVAAPTCLNSVPIKLVGVEAVQSGRHDQSKRCFSARRRPFAHPGVAGGGRHRQFDLLELRSGKSMRR